MKIWLTMKGLLTVIQAEERFCQPCQTCSSTSIVPTPAKSLWDELDRKYNTEEQGLEKYFLSKFMRYHMVEDRSVAEQTHEIINLEHALADAEMKLPGKFLVMSIVDKFPKSWENFGMTLKHQKGRLSLDDLMIAISIEEEHRN
ncbi:UNVERIFIED_CONTAM: hypothetical protein Sradi_6828900 [Sesamum radiatum]|uniref:Uncharacterized protein n=1 Tax=Sesamum radiatum TaxID=300843 RepID=A0AAW2JUC9_SESRA